MNMITTMLILRGEVPGVPAAGHLTSQGYWHPGGKATCGKTPCKQTNEKGRS